MDSHCGASGGAHCSPKNRLIVFAAFLAFAAPSGHAECPEGCPSACPSPAEVQSEFVRSSFSLDRFWGTYYELQYHDISQPPLHCHRSVRTQRQDDARSYLDRFSTYIGGTESVVCELLRNATDEPAVFSGLWRGYARQDVQEIDTAVIDVGLAANGTYEWLLEFQCKDNGTQVKFASIAFYHRSPLVDVATLETMEARARASGIGWLLDSSPGLTQPKHAICVEGGLYPAEDASPRWCGHGGLLG